MEVQVSIASKRVSAFGVQKPETPLSTGKGRFRQIIYCVRRVRATYNSINTSAVSLSLSHSQ